MTYEEILSDANNLYRAYKASVKGSKWKETTQKFMMNFLRYIFSIQEDLLNRTLENGPVEEFSLSERGQVRPISSIRIRDRIVRHALCDEILLPEVKKHIIYDNGASIKGRGISHQRERFEVHLRRYYKQYGNEGWILFGDFSKFYDNIIHEIAKRELLKLFDDDEFIDWLLTLIFDGFKIDVSYMTDEEYANCMTETFNKLDYREIPKEQLTGEKWMEKSVNIGDQLSQVIGIYYPYRTYKFLQVKYTLTKDGKIVKRINPDRVTTMRRKLKKLAIKVANGEIPYENIENMFRGWMGSFYKLLSRQQRKNLITLYEDLFDKTLSIVGKKLVIFDKEE